MNHQAALGERFDCLTDVYRCCQRGACPSQRAAHVAAVIASCVAGLAGDSTPELTSMSLTLVEDVACALAAQSLPPATVLYFSEVLKVLFQDMDLMSHLVHQFQNSDQIVNHLAAKTVSACVCYHGAISPVWEQKCVQVFHSSSPGPELDACLWSVTEVLKRLMKGAHEKTVGKLLAVLDPSLSALCSKFLPEEQKRPTQCLMEATRSQRWASTFCLLLELLELLTASSLRCGDGVCLKSQRLTHIHSLALLTTISCSSDCFVKKRVLLLLKRALLQKAGEDWALGEVVATRREYEHFTSDTILLAQSVLTAVSADWLHSVTVDWDSFFGGVRHTGGAERHTPDRVTLRAVSLLLLKSMELHLQTAAGTGLDWTTEVSAYLQSLWGFLKRSSVQQTEVTHTCCWVSLLFGEQDDDTMEAAKALLSIFLYYRRSSGLKDSAVMEAACASGCNPHCHFLLLLRSVSFDHSLLLDFLISTETCFLEYLVRYLKYLRTDWQGFRVACGRISASHASPISLQKSLPVSCGGDPFALKQRGEIGEVESSSCVQNVVSPVEIVGLAAGLRLVDYGSSDESDPENMDSQDEAGNSVLEETTFGSAVPIIHYDSSHSAGLASDSTHEQRLLKSEQTSWPNMAAPSGHVTCETSAKAVCCLSELRDVVTRLHSNRLFPYNPCSLLKLLAQV